MSTRLLVYCVMSILLLLILWVIVFMILLISFRFIYPVVNAIPRHGAPFFFGYKSFRNTDSFPEAFFFFLPALKRHFRKNTRMSNTKYCILNANISTFNIFEYNILPLSSKIINTIVRVLLPSFFVCSLKKVMEMSLFRLLHILYLLL